jgi:hypothetical protein
MDMIGAYGGSSGVSGSYQPDNSGPIGTSGSSSINTGTSETGQSNQTDSAGQTSDLTQTGSTGQTENLSQQSDPWTTDPTDTSTLSDEAQAFANGDPDLEDNPAITNMMMKMFRETSIADEMSGMGSGDTFEEKMADAGKVFQKGKNLSNVDEINGVLPGAFNSTHGAVA